MSTNEGKRIRIALAMPTDFEQWPTGGGLPTAKIFLKYARSYPFDFTLFGLSWRPDEQPGKEYRRTIYGVDYPFIPLNRGAPEVLDDRRPAIPLRLQTFAACLRRGRLITDGPFDLLYLHAPELMPLMLRNRQPILYNFHGIEEAGAQYSRYALFRSVAFLQAYQHVIGFIVNRADQLICVDQESYARYTGRWPERAPDFHLVWTATDVERFAPIERAPALRTGLGLPVDRGIVLYVGRLSSKKGVDLIIDACARLALERDDLALVIAGDGEERAALEEQARRLGLAERTFFFGKVAYDDLPKLYNCADVSVVASHHESLGLVINEALACGTPVVSTRVGIAPLVIRDGENGYLLPERTAEALARGIDAALRLGPAASPKCVAAAAEYGRTSERICQVILDMCGAKSGADR